MKYRIEHDALGDVAVPQEQLWGAQTQRSLTFFNISHERMPDELIRALAWVKRAAAIVNRDLGLLATEKAQVIVAVTDEIIAGHHVQEFPLVVWQTGSGTQTNMNMNEVIANRAKQLAGINLHPNDDVNLGQSSNDVIPSAMHVAVALAITSKLIPTIDALQNTCALQSINFRECIKLGRTHLQDATPITLGQEFSGYTEQLNQALSGINTSLSALYQLAIGGTAVGTGLNTHGEFGSRVATELNRCLGLPFRRADNSFSALAAHAALVNVHAALKNTAVAMIKIANDIRWLASGPRSGLGEISLPANEPGSSIMAGKVNPTQCEALIMSCYQIMGNDVTVSLAGSSGNFELNVCKPLIAYAVCQSIRLLNDSLYSFDHHCVRGISANREHMRALVDQSLMLATALVPHIGYQRTAEITHQAHAQGTTLRAAALASGYVSAADFDRWVRVESMLESPR